MNAEPGHLFAVLKENKNPPFYCALYGGMGSLLDAAVYKWSRT